MELVYRNAEGATVKLRPAKPYFLSKVDGMGSIRQSVNTFTAPDQDGAFFISGNLDMRNVTLEGNLVAAGPEELAELRRSFLRVLTPKQQGTLVYRDRQIACVVEEAGFAEGTSHRVPAFFISLLCPSPFFEAINAIRAELAAWVDAFSFPLSIPASGIEMGYRQPSQIITVENDGDAPCGMEIIFNALGSVVNPSLLNVDTGEYVKLLSTMAAGQELRVFTHFAGKRVEKLVGTTVSNAFALIDPGSTFLQLAPGENTMKYDAAASLDLLEVSVLYRPLYIGV